MFGYDDLTIHLNGKFPSDLSSSLYIAPQTLKLSSKCSIMQAFHPRLFQFWRIAQRSRTLINLSPHVADARARGRLNRALIGTLSKFGCVSTNQVKHHRHSLDHDLTVCVGRPRGGFSVTISCTFMYFSDFLLSNLLDIYILFHLYFINF
jgi:hypothetical protein